MKFYGKRFGVGYVERRKRPFFRPGTSILVMDVDGVVLDGRGFNERFEEETIKFIEDFPRVRRVYWSTRDPIGLAKRKPDYVQRTFREHFPLNHAHLYIAGADWSTGEPVKDLSLLSTNTSRVIAVEDDNYFTPREQVIHYTTKNRASTIFKNIRARFESI